MAVLTYDRALFCSMLLDARACDPDHPPPQIGLQDVSAATGLDEDEAWDFLRREAALLADIEDEVTHDTGLPPPDRPLTHAAPPGPDPRSPPAQPPSIHTPVSAIPRRSRCAACDRPRHRTGLSHDVLDARP